MSQPASIPRLRILHIVSGDRWAGAEVQAFTLLKELSKNHDVFAIVLNRGELAQRLESVHIPITIHDEAKLNSWQIFNGIRQTLKRVKPNIVHTHRQKENVLGSIANKLSINASCLRTAHGDAEFKPGGVARIQAGLDMLCGRFLQQAVIAVSDDLHQKLESRFTAAKIHTVLNGIDPQQIRVNLQMPDFKTSMPDNIHLGIVGRLDPVKRIDIFLNMAGILLQKQLDIPWHFHLFGEGELEHEMKSLAKSLGISEKTTFHGHRMDIKDCIYGLNGLVMCSDHEGLPMTALESIAIGTPMIAHRTGGLTDLLKESPERLVRHQNAEDYAGAVIELLADGVCPPMEYPLKYHIEHTAANTAKLYHAIL